MVERSQDVGVVKKRTDHWSAASKHLRMNPMYGGATSDRLAAARLQEMRHSGQRGKDRADDPPVHSPSVLTGKEHAGRSRDIHHRLSEALVILLSSDLAEQRV